MIHDITLNVFLFLDLVPGTKIPLSKLEGRMMLSYTCKVCSTKNVKFISKHAYTKGKNSLEKSFHNELDKKGSWGRRS